LILDSSSLESIVSAILDVKLEPKLLAVEVFVISVWSLGVVNGSS